VFHKRGPATAAWMLQDIAKQEQCQWVNALNPNLTNPNPIATLAFPDVAMG